MREIEVKMRVNDMAALEQALISRGCILGKNVRQEDVIYGQSDRYQDTQGNKYDRK